MTRPSTLRLAPAAIPVRPAAAPAYPPFAGHAPALVQDTLDRILASVTFGRSIRHRSFLRHVVQAALEGRHAALRETVIGLEVFARDSADYDPRSDPIVRIEAGRVREKLARYYADEGRSDAFEIQLPVGGYLPRLARRAAQAPVRSLGSFAVLPFASLSSQAADGLFCEALADQLIDRLSRVPGVRVVGRLSAGEAQARTVDMKVVGKLLGVQHVVTGSVQRAGGRYRCIAQVIRTRDRVCVWSQRLESDVAEQTDLFAFQDRIADVVTTAGPLASTGDSTGDSDAHSTEDSDAHSTAHSAALHVAASPARFMGGAPARDLYERARYLVQVRSNEGLEKGIALLARSIELAPDFAPAHSQLGIALSAYYGIMARPTLPAFREVERCARRALALDPLDGEARALLANIAFRVDRDWTRAEPLYLEALRVAPNSAAAHQLYAAALVFNGRYLEAVEHARIAFDLDPLNVTVRIHLAVVTAYARDYATALDEFRAILDLEPDHFYTHVMAGSTYLWAGDGDAARRHFDRACEIAPGHPIPLFDQVFLHGMLGRREQGRRQLDALLVGLEGTHYQRYNRAMAESFLGDVDALCAALREAAAAHELLFISLPADPSFDAHRDDPRLVALMEEYGLPRLPPSPFANGGGERWRREGGEERWKHWNAGARRIGASRDERRE